MPVTFLTFAMGYLAIIGFPGFSGFWSKDKIIETALAENPLVGICALLGAGVTGFYMTRLMLMTFFTEKRWEPGVHPHESPKVMTVPLIVLAALSVLGGVLLLGDWIVDLLAPVVGVAGARGAAGAADRDHVIMRWWWRSACRWPGSWSASGRCRATAPQDVSFVTRAARADLYGDAINEGLVVGPGRHLVPGLTTMDRVGVDGAVMGGSAAVGGLAGACARSRTASCARTHSPCSPACCWSC